MDAIDFLDKDSFLLIEKLLERKHYLRELAEAAGLSPSHVHKIVSRLESAGIVAVERQKNRKVFALNNESPLTRRLLSLLCVHKITFSRAYKRLEKMKPKGIYLFGSAASGEIRSDSDIDFAVFFERKTDSLKLSEIKRDLSNELKKEIQLIVLTPQKISSMKKEKTELLQQIRDKGIVLDGEALE
ncbi:MAG: nucleotidyltransferase domain-containing protein [Candidatus Diapherotrites archaeon]